MTPPRTRARKTAPKARKVTVGRAISPDEEAAAEALRKRFARSGTLVLNLVSAPGSGKTELVTKTASTLKGEFAVAAIAGDVRTDLDAARIARAGIPAVAIETGGGCHLSARRVEQAARSLPGRLDILFIENVGNLVCPSAVDLGEDGKVVLVSLPEGDDKPAKYPAIFAHASAFVISKIDLAPVCSCNPERMKRDALALRPDLAIFELSARTGEGMDRWLAWLREGLRRKRGRR